MERPFRADALLGDAVDVYREHAPTLWHVVAAVVVPAQGISALAITAATRALAGRTGFSDVVLGLLVGILTGVLPLVTSTIASACAMQAIGQAYVGEEPDWRESLHYAAKRLDRVLFVAVVFGVGVAIGLAVLVVPGVYLAVIWSVAVPVLLLEDCHAKAALDRSMRLVKPRFWPVCGTLALGLLAVLIAQAVVRLPIALLTLFLDDGFFANYVRTFLQGVVGQVVTIPFTAILIVLVYFELRAGDEGIEPAHLAKAVAPPGGRGPRPSLGDLREPVEAFARKAKKLVAHHLKHPPHRRRGSGASGESLDLLQRDGPLAIAFTDLEASTTLTQHLGDAAARERLREHDAILRAALARHDGREVKHLGDGLMVCFGSCWRAVGFAIDVQRELAQRNESELEFPLRVRIGINAGEPMIEDNDLFGMAVQVASRICREAKPGQILVSEVVRQLALGRGYSFVRRGPVALRGFEEPFQLYEVDWVDARSAG